MKRLYTLCIYVVVMAILSVTLVRADERSVQRSTEGAALLEKIDALQGTITVSSDEIDALLESFRDQAIILESLLELLIDQSETFESQAEVLANDAGTCESLTENLSSEVSIVESLYSTINNETDLLLMASADSCTPLYNDGAATIVIDQPGHYCCAEDIMLLSGASAVPVISIQASNVMLNLNSFEVYSEVAAAGIEVASGASSVVIYNGTVRSNNNGTNGVYLGTGVQATVQELFVRGWSDGISASSASDVTMSKLLIHSCDRGIHCQNTTTLMLSECMSSGNNVYGYFMDTCVGVTLRGVSAFDNGSNGIRLLSCDSVVLNGCITEHNLASGVLLNTVSNGMIFNCVSQQNGQIPTPGSGFYVQGSSNLVFMGCVADNNVIFGYQFIDANVACVLQGCTASSNTIRGFDLGSVGGGTNTDVILERCQAIKNLSGGFAVSANSSNIIFRSCSSLHNSGVGFYNDNSGTGWQFNRYYKNTAYGNDTDYDGIAAAATVAATAATYWPANVIG